MEERKVEREREGGREGEIKGRGRHKLGASGCPRVTMDAKGFTMKDIHTHSCVTLLSTYYVCAFSTLVLLLLLLLSLL